MSNIFERNLTLKIISIIIAIVIWAAVQSQEEIEINKKISDIPVEFRNEAALKDKELIMVSDSGNDVTIKIRGNTKTLSKVDHETVRAYVDLSLIDKPGKQKRPIVVEGIPSDVKIEGIPEYTVNVESLITKDVPIHLAIAGFESQEEEGLEIHSTEVQPAYVKVSGAESQVDKVVEGRVGLDLTNNQTTIERNLGIQLLDPDGHILPESKVMKMQQDNATVRVVIYPKKTVGIELNYVGSLAKGYTIQKVEIMPAEIVVTGPPDLLDTIDKVGTEILDIEGANDNIHRSVRIQQYEDIYLSAGQPRTVDVLVRVQMTDVDRDYSVEGIHIRNLPGGLSADPGGSGALVTLRGDKSVLDNIDKTDIKIYLDLTGASKGEYRYPLHVDIPQDTQLIAIEPQEITVRIK